MSDARLTAIELERFKSYRQTTRVPLGPLTVILGRNNSGKSTLIQALLLLKQTLAQPRADLPIHLEGFVEATTIRELTTGWPDSNGHVEGPRIAVEWKSVVDVARAHERLKYPDTGELKSHVPVAWIRESATSPSVRTCLDLTYQERSGQVGLKTIALTSKLDATNRSVLRASIEVDGTATRLTWQGERASSIDVELDHFIPYARINRSNVGPRSKQRSWFNAFDIAFGEPLEDLKQLLGEMFFLGSTRTRPQIMYRKASLPPSEVGESGQYAPQLLSSRGKDAVHFVPPRTLIDHPNVMPSEVAHRGLADAVNQVLGDLGMEGGFRIHDLGDLGFQMFFGKWSLQHVGHGLGHILPTIVAGLMADPLRFEAPPSSPSLSRYAAATTRWGHGAFEEPEAHLHPKMQSKLAVWFVTLTMARRALLVETHSDHIVRGLRRLVACAERGSELERWYADNVTIVHVAQRDGESTIETSRLTPEGGLTKWPADFMDEATDQERAIYERHLDKSDEVLPAREDYARDVGEEPDGPLAEP